MRHHPRQCPDIRAAGGRACRASHTANVPPKLEVLGSKAFLEGHGVGTQNYVCVPCAASASGVAYVLFTPEATLFSDGLAQLTTHYIQRVNTSGGSRRRRAVPRKQTSAIRRSCRTRPTTSSIRVAERSAHDRKTVRARFTPSHWPFAISNDARDGGLSPIGAWSDRYLRQRSSEPPAPSNVSNETRPHAPSGIGSHRSPSVRQPGGRTVNRRIAAPLQGGYPDIDHVASGGVEVR